MLYFILLYTDSCALLNFSNMSMREVEKETNEIKVLIIMYILINKVKKGKSDKRMK